MAEAAADAGVPIVTGDTKVVDRGAADGIYISTSGIGVIPEGRELKASRVRPGYVVIMSGTMGDHGTAVMLARGDLALDADIASDTAALHGLVESLLASAPATRWLRDATRGGVGTVCNELARAAEITVVPEVVVATGATGRGRRLRTARNRPSFYVANEGKFVAVVAPGEAEAALAALRSHPLGRDVARVGEIREEPPGIVRRYPDRRHPDRRHARRRPATSNLRERRPSNIHSGLPARTPGSPIQDEDNDFSPILREGRCRPKQTRARDHGLRRVSRLTRWIFAAPPASRGCSPSWAAIRIPGGLRRRMYRRHRRAWRPTTPRPRPARRRRARLLRLRRPPARLDGAHDRLKASSTSVSSSSGSASVTSGGSDDATNFGPHIPSRQPRKGRVQVPRNWGCRAHLRSRPYRGRYPLVRQEAPAEIDAACSRFRSDSELAVANRSSHPVAVGPLLAQAIDTASRAARLTDGDVDPTVGRAMQVLGYDRDFADIQSGRGPDQRAKPACGRTREI